MHKQKNYILGAPEKNIGKLIKKTPIRDNMSGENRERLKKELLKVFHKFGYLQGNQNYEVKFKITSGNIAWININSIEIIK